jgi:hypothetical protein
MGEPFPEIPPGGAIPKTEAWKILAQQWLVIEPKLFTPAGSKYIGRPVRFDSVPVSLGKPLVVRTVAGTVARVSNIPKGDMELVREFRKPPANITVEGVLTAIDLSNRTITIKAYGVRPDNYPYYATAERRAVILDKASRVNEGQLAAEVEKILGRPDEINDTFRQVKGTQKTGYSYVYLVQRLRERGSEQEKDEKLIRIRFGLDDRVRRIDRKL